MRFGIIGAGTIGQIRARAIAGAAGLDLAAVFDADAAAAGAVAGRHGAAATDLPGLLGRDDIDAVVVSSPPQYHEEQVLSALDAGKHVLCEKPLANSAGAARRMVEAAIDAGRVLTTGFNHRYFPAVRFVRETLESGLIGELDHVRAFAGHPGLSEFRSASEYDPAVIGGGAMMDVGVHMTDLARHLLGEVDEVYGAATERVWHLEGAEDNALALFRSPAGVVASYQATWSEWKGYRFHIEAYGTLGMARAYYAPMFSMRVVSERTGGPRRRELNLYPRILLREKRRGWQSTVEQTFREELADFARLCAGGAGGAIADGAAGLRAAEIAEAVYESTRTRQPVTLPPLPAAAVPATAS